MRALHQRLCLCFEWRFRDERPAPFMPNIKPVLLALRLRVSRTSEGYSAAVPGICRFVENEDLPAGDCDAAHYFSPSRATVRIWHAAISGRVRCTPAKTVLKICGLLPGHFLNKILPQTAYSRPHGAGHSNYQILDIETLANSGEPSTYDRDL